MIKGFQRLRLEQRFGRMSPNTGKADREHIKTTNLCGKLHPVKRPALWR